MKLKVYNLANQTVGEIEVSDAVFGCEVKPHLFYEVVRLHNAERRAGTFKGKTRAEVSGGGKKPYKQKGTGRARQGTTRAVQFVGGGWAFAKRPRDFSFTVNRQKKRLALCGALSMLVKENRLKVVDAFTLEQIKTKEAVSVLKRLELTRAIVVDGQSTEDARRFDNNETLRLSVRNLTAYKYLRPDGVNVYDILRFGGAVVTRAALKGLETRLQP